MNYELTNIGYDKLEELQKLFLGFADERKGDKSLIPLSKEKIKLNVEKYLKNDKKMLLGVSFGGELVGFVGFSKRDTNPVFVEVYQYINIDYIYVSKEHRGKKVSSLLFDGLKDRAKEENVSRVRLVVMDGNDKAINVYNKWGFQKIKSTMGLMV